MIHFIGIELSILSMLIYINHVIFFKVLVLVPIISQRLFIIRLKSRLRLDQVKPHKPTRLHLLLPTLETIIYGKPKSRQLEFVLQFVGLYFFQLI